MWRKLTVKMLKLMMQGFEWGAEREDIMIFCGYMIYGAATKSNLEKCSTVLTLSGGNYNYCNQCIIGRK